MPSQTARAWLVLVASGVLEAVWATALGRSDGLSRPLPAVVFVVALTISMIGLGRATKHIAVGTAYAAWVGVGSCLTVLYAMVSGAEAVTPWRVLFLSGIIISIVGLRALPTPAATDEPELESRIQE